MTEPKTKPIQIADGRVKVNIWTNQGKNGRPIYSVQPKSSYRDNDGTWHDTTSFTGAEILQLQQLLGVAYERIRSLKQDDSEEQQRGFAE